MSKTAPRPDSRKTRRAIVSSRKREKVRELEDVLRKWAVNPPPPINDEEPGYKP